MNRSAFMPWPARRLARCADSGWAGDPGRGPGRGPWLTCTSSGDATRVHIYQLDNGGPLTVDLAALSRAVASSSTNQRSTTQPQLPGHRPVRPHEEHQP